MINVDNQSLTSAPRKQFDHIVIGGGITGVATTYYLSQSGADVALLEQFDLNTQASGRNAGGLHGQIQFQPFAQLGVEWAKSFLPALSFLADSLKIWSTLSSDLETDLETSNNGGLMVAETITDMRLLESKVRLENRIGIPSRMLDRAELLAQAPYISPKMSGAAFCPIEGKANPLLTTPAFAGKAREAGATILTGIKVFNIKKEQDGFRIATSDGDYISKKVVITSNAGLSKLTRPFGIALPISDEPIQVSVTEQVEKFIKYLIYFTTEKLTLKQAQSGSLLIGGGWPAKIKQDGTHVLNQESLRSNLRVALKVVPSIAEVKLIRTWIGVGNETPDHRPIIDEIPGATGAFVGIFPAMGFSAGPLLGKTLAELVINKSTDRDLSEFRMDRFS